MCCAPAVANVAVESLWVDSAPAATYSAAPLSMCQCGRLPKCFQEGEGEMGEKRQQQDVINSPVHRKNSLRRINGLSLKLSLSLRF